MRLRYLLLSRKWGKVFSVLELNGTYAPFIMLLVLSMGERIGTYDFARFLIAEFRDGPCSCILINSMRLSMAERIGTYRAKKVEEI